MAMSVLKETGSLLRWTIPHAVATDEVLSPLLDHSSFKLCKDSHHPKQRLACWRGGVQPVLVEIETDSLGMDLPQEVNEVLQGPSQSIHAPGHDEVTLFSGYGDVERIELGASILPLRPADPSVYKLSTYAPPLTLGDLS